MVNEPRKRYGKEAKHREKVQALAALAACGVSQQAVRNKTSKTDQDFLDSLIETLHGVAIGLDSRDLTGMADLDRFIEARSLSFRIHRKFVTARGGSPK